MLLSPHKKGLEIKMKKFNKAQYINKANVCAEEMRMGDLSE